MTSIEPDDVECGLQDEATIRPDEYTPQAAATAKTCPLCGRDSYYCDHAAEIWEARSGAVFPGEG